MVRRVAAESRTCADTLGPAHTSCSRVSASRRSSHGAVRDAAFGLAESASHTDSPRRVFSSGTTRLIHRGSVPRSSERPGIRRTMGKRRQRSAQTEGVELARHDARRETTLRWQYTAPCRKRRARSARTEESSSLGTMHVARRRSRGNTPHHAEDGARAEFTRGDGTISPVESPPG